MTGESQEKSHHVVLSSFNAIKQIKWIGGHWHDMRDFRVEILAMLFLHLESSGLQKSNSAPTEMMSLNETIFLILYFKITRTRLALL